MNALYPKYSDNLLFLRQDLTKPRLPDLAVQLRIILNFSSSWSSWLYLPSTGITSMDHHDQYLCCQELNPGLLCILGKHQPTPVFFFLHYRKESCRCHDCSFMKTKGSQRTSKPRMTSKPPRLGLETGSVVKSRDPSRQDVSSFPSTYNVWLSIYCNSSSST